MASKRGTLGSNAGPFGSNAGPLARFDVGPFGAGTFGESTPTLDQREPRIFVLMYSATAALSLAVRWLIPRSLPR
jgi:hypothetical protein